MNRLSLLLVVLCCAACCHQTQQENIVYVDIDNPQKVSLFDYFGSIELIPFETDTDVLMQSIGRLVLYQNRYYALDKPQAMVFVFDQTGKFLFKIDNKGNGPGEYNFIGDMHINPFTGCLELLESYGSVHEYDLSGNFIKTKRIAYPGFRAVHQFAAVDSHIHVFYSMFQPQKIIYFNLDDNKFLHEEFEEAHEIGSFGYDNLYSYMDEWFYFRPFHPHVYKAGKGGLEEVFRFDFGEYTREGTKAVFSMETRHSLEKLGEEAFAQFPYWIRKLGHNSKYVIAQVPWGNVNDRSCLIYDKSVRKGKFIPVFTEGVDFEPNMVTDEYVLSWCIWSELKKRITKEMLDDKNKAIFEELLQSEMELNPVLIKYRFK